MQAPPYRRELCEEGVFRLDPRWRHECARRACLNRAAGDQLAESDVAIGKIGVAAAIAREHGRTDAADRIDLFDLLRLLEVGHQKIALRIDVGRSMVSDLSGVMAEAESVVEHGRAEPDRQAVIASVERLPEAHVMAGPRGFF